jgi:hypothetical protein
MKRAFHTPNWEAFSRTPAAVWFTKEFNFAEKKTSILFLPLEAEVSSIQPKPLLSAFHTKAIFGISTMEKLKSKKRCPLQRFLPLQLQAAKHPIHR